MAKCNFLSCLINILKKTDYVEVVSLKKQPNDWIGLEDKKIIKQFLDWFVNCITYENCLTSDEVLLYRELKCNNKLVPNEELDQQLSEYFNFESSSKPLDIDLQFSIAETEKELQALRSLEDFLKKREKNERVADGLDVLGPFIKNEINELEALNNQCNESFNKYVHAWDDLKTHLSEEHSVDLCKNKYSNMIYLNNQINLNVNDHLKKDFKEISPTEGKINVITPLDYWVISQKLSEVENSIIDTTAKMHGISMIMSYLMSLKSIISVNPQETSLSDIETFFNEVPNPGENLKAALTPALEDEVNSLVKFPISDTKKCAAFLEDRFNRLSRIENILQNKIILNQTLKFIIKRDGVIRDYQLNTLNKFSKNIELLATQHEHRIECMRNHKNINKMHSLDPNYKKMMKYLGVQNSDYKTLSSEMMKFKESLCKSYSDIEEDLQLFQKKFSERFNEIKDVDRLMIHGPTREIFGHYTFRNLITDLRDNLKTQNKISETFTKVEEMFKTLKSGCKKKDCIWQKILENPKEFLRRLDEIEEETERLRERVRIEVMNK